MNGFLLIDKEKGATSFSLISALRKKLNIRKIGFAGTLDPLASGLMILAVGEYTKFLHFLEKADKTYQTDIYLGAKSSTYDAEGEIEYFDLSEKPTLAQIERVLSEKLTGEISQIPPIFSAIKVDGKRSYSMARKNENFELSARKVTIYQNKILSFDYPKLSLEIACSSGTYIRSIAHDLGKMLGCGGYISDLRRISIGPRSVENALKIEQIDASYLIDAKDFFATEQMRIVKLNSAQFDLLRSGGFVELPFSERETDYLLDSRKIILAEFEGRIWGILECASKDNDEEIKKFDRSKPILVKFKKYFNL